MKTFTLNATTRIAGRVSLKKARREQKIPAVVYGHGLENKILSVDKGAFKKILSEIGESSIVDLTIDGKKTLKVLVPEIDKDPVSDDVIHVGFRNIRMDEKIDTTIDLEFVGEAPVAKTIGGIIVTNIESIDVKCLPTALVDSIIVDISGLTTYESSIRVKDLIVPDGIVVDEDPDLMIVSVSKPAEEIVDKVQQAEKVATEPERVGGKDTETDGADAKKEIKK